MLPPMGRGSPENYQRNVRRAAAVPAARHERVRGRVVAAHRGLPDGRRRPRPRASPDQVTLRRSSQGARRADHLPGVPCNRARPHGIAVVAGLQVTLKEGRGTLAVICGGVTDTRSSRYAVTAPA